MLRFILILLISCSPAFAGGNPLNVRVENKIVKNFEMTKKQLVKTNSNSGPVMKSPKVDTGAISEFELAKYQYCGSDSDCIVVTNGCCDCANGSEDVSINKDKLEDFEKRFNCLNYTCSKKDAEPRCGQGVVSCISNQCYYFNN